MIKRALLALAAVPALLLAPLGVGAATAQAQAPQPKTVTGRVTSEQGDPMGSVSVIIKGTNQGTMTRVDGNYSIRVAAGQILVYRLIGNAPKSARSAPTTSSTSRSAEWRRSWMRWW